MRNRIVSERDLEDVINMLMAGNIPTSTSDVLNLVQRLQNTDLALEPKPKAEMAVAQESRPEPTVEVARDDV